MIEQIDRFVEAPGNYLILFYSFEQYVSDLKEFLRRIEINAQKKVIYISPNKPAKDFETFSNFVVIDCVSKLLGGDISEQNNCVYSSPYLPELSLVLDKTIEEVENAMILFDSPSTFLIYNPSNNVLKFINTLTTKVKYLDIHLFILEIRKEIDERFLAKVAQFCDRIVKLYETIDKVKSRI